MGRNSQVTGGDGDVGPLLAGQGLLEDEQAALGELDVDPGLQVVEPLLARRQQPEDRGQGEGEDEVGHDRPGRGADEHAEHEADQQAEDHSEHVVQDLGGASRPTPGWCR